MIALTLFAMMALQDDTAATTAIETFNKAYAKEKGSDLRVNLVNELAKTQHAKVIQRLGTLMSDPDKAVRLGTAGALATFTGSPELKKAAAGALCSALHAGANSNDPDALIAILGALGVLGDDSAASKVKEYFDDKNNKIAVAAVSASGNIKSKVFMDPLIQILRDCEKQQKADQPAPPPASSAVGGRGAKVMPTKGGGTNNNQPDPTLQAKRERTNALIGPTQTALCMLSGQGSLKTSDQFDQWWSKNHSALK